MTSSRDPDVPSGRRKSRADEGRSTARRVIQVARHIGPGFGVPQVVASLERAFVAEGAICERITLRPPRVLTKAAAGSRVRAKAALLVEVVWFTFAGTIAVRRVRRRSPDALILVHGDPLGGDVYVNHGLLKRVLLDRARGRLYVSPNPMHWFILARERLRYRSRFQRAIVSLNDRDAADLRALYPDVISPIHVIPNGIDLDLYRNVGEELRDPTRSRLGITPSDRVLLFVGHEYERKGLPIVLRSLRQLPERVTLIVVGGTPEMIAAAESSDDLKSTDQRVIFVGTTQDPRPYYAAADVFVLPSAYEAAALVMLEALASGLAVVATATGSAADVVTSGVNGEIVDRTPESVAAGILHTLELLRVRPHATAEACRSSVERYSWPSIARQYLELLEEVANSR